MRKTIFLICLFFLSTSSAFSVEMEEQYLINRINTQKISRTLYRQPTDGPFAVFLFTGSAYGSDISVLNIDPAAGPGNIQLPPPKEWDNWDTYKRFWQGMGWAQDVTSFAWSSSLKYLYVATSSIYGDGGVFELDLVNKKAKKIIPLKNAPYFKKAESAGLSSFIDSIDLKDNTLKVSLRDYENNGKLIATETVKMK